MGKKKSNRNYGEKEKMTFIQMGPMNCNLNPFMKVCER